MSRRKEIQKLVLINQRRLQKLREEQALKGINARPELLIEIEDLETEIKHLQKELAASSSAETESPYPPTGITASLNWGKIGAIATVLALIVAIIGLVVSSNFRSSIFGEEPPPSPSAGINFIVRVINANSGEPIPQVAVTFQSGTDIRTEISDNNGLAVFTKVVFADRIQARILISDNRYEAYDQNTTIDKSDPLLDAPLLPKNHPTNTPPSPATGTPKSPTPTTIPVPPTLPPPTRTLTPTSIPPTLPPPTVSPTFTPPPTSTPPPVSSTPASQPTCATITVTAPLPHGIINTSEMDVRWHCDGPLPPDYGFEIKIWLPGATPLGAHDALNDQKLIREDSGEYVLRLGVESATGYGGTGKEYYVAVSLVRISPAYQDTGIMSEPVSFTYEYH